MNLRRKETKLTVITGGGSHSWRARHTTSYSVGDYYYNPSSFATQRTSLPSGVSNNDTPRADAWNQYRVLPPTPTTSPPHPLIPRSTKVPTFHSSNPHSTVFLLGRPSSAEPPETPNANDNTALRRKGHIRRRHRRAVSECPAKSEPVIETPVSPRDLDKIEALTPLFENVAEMYSDRSSGGSSYTSTIRSPDVEESLDSPSVYSVCLDDDEELHEEESTRQPLLHDWANGGYDRDVRMDEVPEGRLLPKRVATVQLKALLRRRREEAGLPVGAPESPDDY